MKPLYVIFAAILCCLIVSCSKKESSTTPVPSASANNTGKSVKNQLNAMSRSDSGQYSIIIPIDSANRMIASYLYSIPAAKSETTLRAVIFNADSLRAMLSDPSIKNVKLMFAHTLDYINAGNYGVDPGLKANALTVIVAGYNSSGDYVYVRGGVLEHSMPCPTSCPLSGSAANYTLTY